jgi:hypothetical protein
MSDIRPPKRYRVAIDMNLRAAAAQNLRKLVPLSQKVADDYDGESLIGEITDQRCEELPWICDERKPVNLDFQSMSRDL